MLFIGNTECAVCLCRSCDFFGFLWKREEKRNYLPRISPITRICFLFRAIRFIRSKFLQTFHPPRIAPIAAKLTSQYPLSIKNSVHVPWRKSFCEYLLATTVARQMSTAV